MIEIVSNDDEWNSFVRHNNSNIFHTIEWRDTIRHTFGYKPYYLLSREDGSITGCFPMFCVKSFLFGKRFISLPFAFSGDPIYKNTKSLRELLAKAKELSKDAKYLEIRMKQKLPDNMEKDYGLNESMGTYLTVIELTDIDTVLSNMSRDKRRYINKSEDKRLKVREGNENDLKAYHALKVKLSAKKYGIPSEPLSFYNNLWKQMHSKNMIKLFVAEFEGKIIGGIVLLLYKDEVLDFSGAADGKYLNLKPYNFLIWEALKYSCKNKYKYFNFGTSENKSLMDFKESWGAKSYQIPVYSTATSTKGAEYWLFTKTWKRLPATITRLFGPFLVKQKGG